MFEILWGVFGAVRGVGRVLDRTVDTCDSAEDGEQQRSEQQVVLGDISGDLRHSRVHWSRE